MANPPDKPRARKLADRPEETAVLLKAELQRRGMSEAEIEAALRKKKRRKVIEFGAVKSRHLLHDSRPAAKSRISEEVCTVDFAAEQLNLHPRTVLRFIREGRLAATRVGKSYRILRADLEAFAGLPARGETPAEAASLTSVVDIPYVSSALAQTWARTVTSAVNARPRGASPMRADVIYDPDRAHLKIIVVGAPDDAVNLLSLVRLWLDQLRE